MVEQDPSSRSCDLLLIDDNAELVAALREGLEGMGLAVCSATAWDEAMELCQTPRAHRALIDINVGPTVEDGYNLVRQLRGHSDTMTIVMMSGFVNPALRVKARGAGVNLVLEKPVTIKILIQALELCLPGDESPRKGAR